LRKDGSTFPGELRGRQTKYKGKTVRITAARDLSEQKKAEEALRESEENYRSMMEAMDDAIYMFIGLSYRVYEPGYPTSNENQTSTLGILGTFPV